MLSRENFVRLQSLEIYNMHFVVGLPVMSALTSNTIHSLDYLGLGVNRSWWKDNTLFNHLITFLSQQKRLETFTFHSNYLTSE